jgi:hypothetical protein
MATYQVVELTPSLYSSFSDCPIIYSIEELTPSLYSSFSDCPIIYSIEDKGTGVILELIALRTSRNSRNRSF